MALSILCPVHGYRQVPSHAHLLSLAFESLGWRPQLTLPIDGERSREVRRVLGTGDVHLTGKGCWRLPSLPQCPQATLSKSPKNPTGICPLSNLLYSATATYSSLGSPGPDPKSYLLLNYSVFKLHFFGGIAKMIQIFFFFFLRI